MKRTVGFYDKNGFLRLFLERLLCCLEEERLRNRMTTEDPIDKARDAEACRKRVAEYLRGK